MMATREGAETFSTQHQEQRTSRLVSDENANNLHTQSKTSDFKSINQFDASIALGLLAMNGINYKLIV